jgi:hypothetical protein
MPLTEDVQLVPTDDSCVNDNSVSKPKHENNES